ncbi:MAG: TRAP transporter small permease [Deltaproteobacteria bacterium]|nr:TRAP transporter small permease [Deltaproteobacteria bacterium]MBM4323763.1 TRAP transporter small permease [Deltaproteobacteria bacterium]
MKFGEWLNQVDKFNRVFSRNLEWVGVIGILLMFLANFIDVVGAKLFLWPVPGATEVISFAQVLAIAPAVAFTLLLGRHIRVEFIIMRLPIRIRESICGFSSLLSLITFVLILWQSFIYGQSLQRAGEIGSTSHIPFYPFAYIIAFCCIPVCLAFLVEILKSFSEVVKHGSR